MIQGEWGRDCSSDMKADIAVLLTQGHSGSEIYRQLKNKYPDRPDLPSERTIQRYRKRYIENNPAPRRAHLTVLDSRFQWRKMPEYGLPWEASDFTLEVVYEYQKLLGNPTLRKELVIKGLPPLETIGQVQFIGDDDKYDDPEAMRLGPTARTVIWCWRIRQAARGLDDIWAIITLAATYSMFERMYEVFEDPDYLDSQESEDLFIYKPWLSQERRQVYTRDVGKGAAKRHPLGEIYGYDGEES